MEPMGIGLRHPRPLYRGVVSAVCMGLAVVLILAGAGLLFSTGHGLLAFGGGYLLRWSLLRKRDLE